MSRSPTDQPFGSKARSLSPAVQTVVSFLLFVHIFAIGVALVSNAGSPPSQLMAQIRARLLGHYLYATWTDVAYDYHYMRGGEQAPLDMNHTLEAQLVSSGAAQKAAPVEPAGVSGLRQERFQRLAYYVAANLEGTEETLLPSMIGGGLIKQSGKETNDVVLSCLRHPPTPLDPSMRPEPATRIYQSTIRLISGKPIVVSKFEEKGQVKPSKESSADATTSTDKAAASESDTSPQ